MIRIFCLVLTIVSLPFGVRAQQNINPCIRSGVVASDGMCWQSLQRSEKQSRILGIWSGINLGGFVNSLIGQHDFRSNFWRRPWILVHEQTTVGDIINYIDSIFQTPANRSMDIWQAYFLAALRSRDDDSNDYDGALLHFRAGRFIPRRGELVGFIDPNIILIRPEANSDPVEVRLSGTRKGKATSGPAIEFLGGLTWIRQFYDGSCTSEERFLRRVQLDLEYPFDLFDENRRLSAVVYINTYTNGICVNGQHKEFPRSVFDRGGFNLNKFLVRSDSLDVDLNSDPKWTDDNRSSGELYLGATMPVQHAERKELHEFRRVVSAAQ